MEFYQSFALLVFSLIVIGYFIPRIFQISKVKNVYSWALICICTSTLIGCLYSIIFESNDAKIHYLIDMTSIQKFILYQVVMYDSIEIGMWLSGLSFVSKFKSLAS